MQNFKLDSRLAQDCEFIAESPQSVLLLSKNAAYPWFILVPKTIYIELYQLDLALQQQLLKQINQVSQFMQAEFAPDKLNVAAIGNVVKQLHIHLVARFEVDPSWPGVVWGASANQAYSVQQLASIKQAAKQVLGAVFTFE